MEISARHCYQFVKELDSGLDLARFRRLPMEVLSPAARAWMYALFLSQEKGRHRKLDRALAFVKQAEELATDEEYPYSLHLHSMLLLQRWEPEEAVKIAQEAAEWCRALGDDQLLVDILSHLANIYRAMGYIVAAEECEREAWKIDSEKRFRPEISDRSLHE